MSNTTTDFNIEDIYVSEKDKNSFDYLSKSMDWHISQLVTAKKRIKKCRNLYDGIRDKEEFRYLEESFGIETPLSVSMTPLIKTRIDVLLGLLLDETFTYKVSVNDDLSIDKVAQQKIKEKTSRILSAYNKQADSNFKKVNEGQPAANDIVTEKYLSQVESMINQNFISAFEEAASSLIEFFEQDNTIELKQKMKQFFQDLLITGEAYYRTSIPKIGADPVVEICKPENIFYSKNTNNQFLNSGNQPNINAIVHRTYMKRTDILNKWGHLMNKEDKSRLFGSIPSGSSSNVIHSPRELEYANNGSYGNEHTQFSHHASDAYAVYHVEWLANNRVELTEEDKDDLRNVEGITTGAEYNKHYGANEGNGKPNKFGWRLDRYEGIRIGNETYLNLGKSRFQPRSIGQPYKTTVSYNGAVYNDRNSGDPYSLALALKDLQDRYDIINFFRDNLIANSGVNGSRINLAGIPKVLGQTFMERLMKFMALRKQGVELIDPTEDGAHLFNHYGDFNNSLDGNALQGLKVAMEMIQQDADIVSGINRHMYAAAEQRDAVANVKAGVRQTSLITKDLFDIVGNSYRHMLTDLINRAKIAYRKGKRGAYIVGHQQVLFDIQAENFCFTDFNIHVVNNSKENMKLEKLRAIIPELIGKGSIKDEVLLKASLSNSTTEVLRLVETSIIEVAQENDQMGKMNQQLQELQQQLEQVGKAAEEAQKELDNTDQQGLALKNRELDIREKEVDHKIKDAVERLRLETFEVGEGVKKDKAIVQLEREQLHSPNTKGNAREIRNDF